MSQQELKSCPFCGLTTRSFSKSKFASIKVWRHDSPRCPLDNLLFSDESWNTRALPDSKTEEETREIVAKAARKIYEWDPRFGYMPPAPLMADIILSAIRESHASGKSEEETACTCAHRANDWTKRHDPYCPALTLPEARIYLASETLPPSTQGKR